MRAIQIIVSAIKGEIKYVSTRDIRMITASANHRSNRGASLITVSWSN
jgi:hypothetical protein